MADLTHRQYKQLRDMTDGHLTLYATVQHYNPNTGQPLDEPVILHIGSDRSDITDPDWWQPLLTAGLIALPAAGNRCTVTMAGHEAVGAYLHSGADRG